MGTPGELVTITIDVLGKGSKYIGLLLYAVEDGALETKVGEWVLPPEGGSPQFWTPPECTGKAVMHTDAGAKHYRHEFHFRAPVAGIGNIRFRVLLKHGTTNGGAFFWPAEDLVLLKSSTISSGPIWVQSDNAASCTSACNAVESQCDAAALVAAHKQDRNNQLSEGPGQLFACHLPLFSYNGEACNMTTLSSDEDGRCFYRDDGLCIPTAAQICNQVAVTGKNPDADGWNTWFGEQIKAIDMARDLTQSGDSIFKTINWDVGVAIAGHSMGGQATAWTAHENCTSQWGIKTAAIHHGVWGTTNEKIGVPVIAMGGTKDQSITVKTKDVFTKSPIYPKAFRDIVGGPHTEPNLVPNPLLATYTAAWFKTTLGVDEDNKFHDMIFGNNEDSLCNSQEMNECIVDEHAMSVAV